MCNVFNEITLRDLYRYWLDLVPSTKLIVNDTEYTFINLPKNLYTERKIKHFCFDGSCLEVELYDK